VLSGPAVGGEDGGVEVGVGVAEPGGALVVEVGEGALREVGGVDAGRVEPAVAELDEAAGGPPTLSRCSRVASRTMSGFARAWSTVRQPTVAAFCPGSVPSGGGTVR